MADAGTLRLLAVAALTVLLGAAVAVALARRRVERVPADAKPFLAHLEELRQRLLVAIAAWLAVVVLALTFQVGWWATRWGDVPVPVFSVYDSLAAQVYRAVAAHVVPPGVQLAALSPMEGFQAQFTVAMGLGVLVALPILLYQLGRFFGPALRPRERRTLLWALVPATGLFLAGALFCYVAVIPVAMAALYSFSDALGAQTWLRVEELPGTVLGFMLGFGIAFETPLVMVALAKVRLVPGTAFLRFWRHAIVAIVIVAGVLTPDPTLVSQVMLAVPLLALYFGGAVAALWVGRLPPNDGL